MPSHHDLCSILDKAGYQSDSIGKCLRQRLRTATNSRIDHYLMESRTYEAFERGDNLAKRFDPVRAVPACLIWADVKDVRRGVVPFPIEVDWNSGIFREQGKTTHGMLRDVSHCLFTRDTRQPMAAPVTPRP